VLGWTALTTLVFWLPVVRGAFEGQSYAWGAFSLSGRGVTGDYWLPLVGAALALLVQWWGWRGGPRALLYPLLGGWHAALAVGAIYLSATRLDDFRFRGDTLGVDVSLRVAGPLFFSAWAIAAGWWVARDLRRPPVPRPPWTAANRRRVVALAGLLPVQLVLLRLGSPESLADQLGVVVTIGQWLLVGHALRPAAAAVPAS
jgi:hypothetical protein